MTRGKKILLILLIIFAAIGGGGFWLYKTVSKTQAELNAAVEPMIKDMAAHQWDKSVIDKYASSALKQWLVTNNITNGMQGLSVLGNVREYNGIQQFNANSSGAALVSLVKFDKGDATVTLQLSKQNGTWLMDSFNVNSPLLLQNLSGQTNAK